MEETKAVSRSVSLPMNLWAKVESHAPSTPGRDRSGYIRNLVEKDLTDAGVLGEVQNPHAELIATAEEVGIDAALAALKRVMRTKTAKTNTAQKEAVRRAA